MTFSICVLPGVAAQTELRIFPRYLESCDPEKVRHHPGRLAWLEDVPSEALPLSLTDGRAKVTYTPRQPGNYLARLRTPKVTLYCYFAVVTPAYVVYRMLAYSQIQPPLDGPEMRNGGIPIDRCLAVDAFPIILDPARGHLGKLLEYQSVFDDVVMPFFDTATQVKANPSFDLEGHIDGALARMRKAGLRVDRAVLDWQALARAVEIYRQRGFDVVDGIIPEGEFHRGAPWFPYWMSREDFLSPTEDAKETMGMIMDFCAGFHFHGPPDFHMLASECNWQMAAPHVDLATREHVLIAKNSGGGPVFVPTLLTFGYRPWGIWPPRDWPRARQLEFDQSFLDDTAFVLTQKYPVVFTRGVDIADYLRSHPASRRRIMSSITHDWLYDRFWAPEWCNAGVDVHCGVRPFNSSLADIRARRPFIWAKPAARELIYYEDARHQCRFEYACPKPLLWYPYDDRQPRGELEGRPEKVISDPDIVMVRTLSADRFEVRYQITGGRPFAGYKVAVWDIPREFVGWPMETNAREFILVENSDGDYRGILVIDLEPAMTVFLSFHKREVNQ